MNENDFIAKIIELPGVTEKQLDQVRRMWEINDNMMVHQLLGWVDTRYGREGAENFLNLLVERGRAKKRLLVYHQNCPETPDMYVAFRVVDSKDEIEFPLTCGNCDDDIEEMDELRYDTVWIFLKGEPVEFVGVSVNE